MIIHGLLPILGAVVAIMLLPLIVVYCLLYPISARHAERDAFLDADMIAAAEASRRQYTIFGYRKRPRHPLISKLLAALTFRRT